MLQPPANLLPADSHRWQMAAAAFQNAYQLQVRDDWAGAIQEYKRSIALYPTAEAHTFLGWVYSFLRLFDEAIAECKRAIAVDPSFGNPYNDIGAYLIEQEKFADAIPWLEKAITATRYEARGYPYYNLGRVYEHLGDWRMAIDCYNAAAKVQPNYSQAIQASKRLMARLN